MKKILYTLLLFLALPSAGMAQRNLVPNRPKYDKQKLHFGFLLGVNVTDFYIKRKGSFNLSDSLYSVESAKQTGFNLGIVSNLNMGNNLALRFIPDLSFAQRNLEYSIFVNGVKGKKVIKKVESTFLEFPLELRFRSNRINNYRIFVLGGGKYSIDMVSQAKVKNKDKEYVKLKRNDFGYTIGAGFEFYMEFFNMSIELKMYNGLNNLLVADPSLYSRTLYKLNSKIFMVNFTFE